MILLDTNICIGLLRGHENVLAAYKSNAGDIAISAMTVGELYYGVGKSSEEDKEQNRGSVDKLVSLVPVVQTNNEIMQRFGLEKARLETLGTRLDDADVLIAATALTLSCPVATANVRHFTRFPGLEIENWFEPRK